MCANKSLFLSLNFHLNTNECTFQIFNGAGEGVIWANISTVHNSTTEFPWKVEAHHNSFNNK